MLTESEKPSTPPTTPPSNSVEAELLSYLKDFVPPNGIQDAKKDVTSFLTVKKNIFYAGIFIFIVLLFIVMFFLRKAIEDKDAKIKSYTEQMAKRDFDVKARDQQILILGNDEAAKDAALAKSRDSVSRAYLIIKKLSTLQKTQYEKYKKDSSAIGNLSLRGKVSFVTGGKR